MRLYITLLVAVATILASSGAVSAATSSGPAKLVQTASFESVNDAPTENKNARFLRKRLTDDSDDLSAEERGGLMDFVKKVKGFISPKEKALKLLSKDPDVLLKKNVPPGKLESAVKLLESKGATKEKVAEFKDIASAYSTKWYKSNNIDPWQ
ncbi:hypothetical protein PF008_g28551 [Phytophthora fragariae]|uniref:RxLR effector protein n=1 Tax=Phytophthora fragariae TaxID=53985 RepID=A0A6G0QBN5_9STRA|nr:hypothetical protein PF008_g28551 [Phytophthora fragariae]